MKSHRGLARSISCAAALLFFWNRPLAAQDSPDSGFKPAPWLRLGAEVRSRTEAASGINFEADHNHLDLLSRVRLSAEVKARDWLKFDVEFQDARTLAGRDGDLYQAHQNQTDIRYAFTDVGRSPGHGWALRAGRQPLSFGDERLIGVDDPWSNRSQRFDGAVVSWSNPRWRWGVFSATLAPPLPNSLDPISAKDRVSGAYGHWSTDRHHLLFEPFVFWTRKRQPLPGGEIPGQWSIWTPGMRLGTDLPFGLTFASETVLQGGHGVGRSIGAWASAVTIARHIGSGDTSPEISAGYNFASGDRSQYDGHQGTFDDLYPAGYNGCGSLDPFAWRNLRDVTWGADWRPRGNWHLAAEVHHYWLATTRDGLYADEGGYLVFAPQASSSRIGSQANVMAQYKRSSFWDISLGYARLFAGPYLRETGLGIALNSVFLNLAFRI